MTLNAGVDGLRFHVSVHGFDDGFACAYCPWTLRQRSTKRPSMPNSVAYPWIAFERWWPERFFRSKTSRP
jgi:hypothetical protein